MCPINAHTLHNHVITLSKVMCDEIVPSLWDKICANLLLLMGYFNEIGFHNQHDIYELSLSRSWESTRNIFIYQVTFEIAYSSFCKKSITNYSLFNGFKFFWIHEPFCNWILVPKLYGSQTKTSFSCIKSMKTIHFLVIYSSKHPR